MKDIYWLSQIQSDEKSLVGERLFFLSQLLQRECPILPGFILSDRLHRQLLLPIAQELLIKDYADDDSRQAFARHSRSLIEQLEIPPLGHANILQIAQRLNSPCLRLQPFLSDSTGKQIDLVDLWRSPCCSCNDEAIITAIKSIWSELFSASSIFYLQKLGLTAESLNLSILVRPLKNAEAAGSIIFDPDYVEIRATWGLEDSIVQGDVEADAYYLERDFGQLIDRRLGHKNYGYRCRSNQQETLSDCLEAYLPPAKLATSYVLDAEAIANLYKLAQNILEQQPRTKYLVWSAFRSPSVDRLQFYWTQISDRRTVDPAIAEKINLNLSKSGKPLLSGLPLSPGKVSSEVAVIANLDNQDRNIAAGKILVTKAIDPQHIAAIAQVKGIITEVGGKNSHAGIVARELNIPAIANARGATDILQTGDRIVLDGDRGHVYRATAKQQLALPLASHIAKNILSPTYPIATKLMVNLSQPESIAAVDKLPIDGVGLLRSELMLAKLLATQTLAQWQESFQRQFVATLSDYLRQFGTAFAPRPVFYRSLDLYAQNSQNEALGDRGTYSYLNDPTLFDLELEALQTVIEAGYHNIKLLLPFVRSLEEFQFCYHRLQQRGLTSQDSFEVWIMAEVPSTVILLPEYIRAGVKGIAIGTNDLTQLILGVDREQTKLSDRGLNANHPAMQRTIAKLIKTAHQHDIECCICGQAPVEYPELIDRLVKWGIDTISVEPNAVAQAYKAIARAEKRLFLKSIAEQQDD